MENIYKVVKIIDPRQIIINAGKDNGINKDSKFEIFGPGEEVIDPTTNESLGYIDLIKAEVIPSSIYDKMCVCKGKTVFLPTANFTSAILPLLETAELNVNPTEMTGGFSEEAYQINVGDSARLINDENDKN